MISGVPDAYQPGRSYDLEVVLRRAGMLRGGFELSARFKGQGMFPGGQQAGTLTPADGRTAVVWDTTRHVAYIEHTVSGSALVDSVGRWRFRWTAPPTAAGAVVLHVAANAANDDDSPLGDYIYTRALDIRSR